MTRCEHCQPLILDHLYGLLEEPEKGMVESHLRECVSCAGARAEAARLQGMLAQAARGAFPQVRFEAPVATPAPAKIRAARMPARRTPHRVAVWLPWAIAAAVLIAVPSTVFPVFDILNRSAAARKNAENSQTALAEKVDDAEKARQAVDEPRIAARRELAARSQALDAVLARWVAAEKDGLAQAWKPTVNIHKPASLQPGAPNELKLLVSVRDVDHTPPNLVAEIREVRGGAGNRTDAVILSQPLNPQGISPQTLRLPADAWTKLTPESELYLVVTSKDNLTGATTEIQERVRLLGPVFATMLVTDKPTYRPGETLFFRSLTLDRTTFLPPNREQSLDYEIFHLVDGKRSGKALDKLDGGTNLVRVTSGKVDPILVKDQPIRGVGCGAFLLPQTLADGDYVLALHERPLAGGCASTIPVPVERTFKVQTGFADDYRKQFGFFAASYRPGDTVEGWADLFFQNKPVANAEVHAFATIDNESIHEVQMRPVTDVNGRVKVRFKLPPELERGDVKLKVEFKTELGFESMATRVPVIGQSVAVEFFPEGGTLIAGVPCRLYFRATTPTGEPVDIKGTITDGRTALAKIGTVTGGEPGANRGIGSFTYTPELGTPLWLKLDSPVGMHAPVLVPQVWDFPVAASAVAGPMAVVGAQRGFALPEAKPEGVVMTVLDPISSPGTPIRVHLRSVGTTRTLVVGAYTRGRLSDTKEVVAEPGMLTEARLMANTDPRGGVVRITVFEKPDADAKGQSKPELMPVAERLVFRRPGESLNLSFTANGARSATGGFPPGGHVELSLAASDEKGNPAAAILYAAAVNSGVARGPKDRLLTTHFLIAGEITTPDAMEYADFLLTDQPKAGEILDLVLATQGWRRFVEQTPAGITKRAEAPSLEQANLLASNGQNMELNSPVGYRIQRQHFETYWPQYESAQKARDRAQAALASANADHTAEVRARELADGAEQARVDATTASDQFNKATEPVTRFQKAGWYGVAGFGMLALLLGGTCLTRPRVRLPLGVGTSGALGLVVFLVFALGVAERSQASLDIPRGAPSIASAPAPEAGSAATMNDQVEKSQDRFREAIAVPTAPNAQSGPWGTVTESFGGKSQAGFGRLAAKSGAMGGGGFGGSGPGRPGGFPKSYDPSMALPIAPPSALPQGPSVASGLNRDGRDAATQRIPNEELNRDQHQYTRPLLKTGSGLSTPMGLAPRAPVPPHPPVALVADAKSGIQAALQSDREWAKDYSDTRAKLAVQQVLDSVARKHATSSGEVRRTVEMFQHGRGWEPGVNNAAPAVVSLSDAAAIYTVESNIPKVTPLVVREYAAQRPGANGEADSADTVLWQPVIVLPTSGKTSLKFHLGAAPGGCQVIVAGHTLDGRIGAIHGTIPVAPIVSAPPTTQPMPGAPVPPPAP